MSTLLQPHDVTVWHISGWFYWPPKRSPMEAHDDIYGAIKAVVEGEGGSVAAMGCGPIGRGPDPLEIVRNANLYDGILGHVVSLHSKSVRPDGGTDGFCQECEWVWPCRTYHVAMGWGEPDDCRGENWCKHASVPYPD